LITLAVVVIFSGGRPWRGISNQTRKSAAAGKPPVESQ
jgi:hypothetical protein